MFRIWAAAVALICCAMPSLAQEVRITPDMLNMALDIRGKTVVIERIQDTENKLTNGFAKTSRPCPPFCIHPMEAGPGIETVGELELIDYLSDYVAQGKGLLIDSRLPDFYSKGTIPGAVNLPFSTVDEANPYRDEILKALGATKSGDSWDFSTALDLLAFCNGPWCDQSPRMLKNLAGVGYPAEKLRYYRGGMQMWLLLGLSVEIP
ncbi:MAG: rhodanese-like domain-containing protein [Brevirhabdus sp.]